MKTIIELREEIDQVDKEIVKLLIRRMDISREIGGKKEKVTDKSREMKVILNVLNASEEKIDPVFLREIYESIITESKKLQLG